MTDFYQELSTASNVPYFTRMKLSNEQQKRLDEMQAALHKRIIKLRYKVVCGFENQLNIDS